MTDNREIYPDWSYPNPSGMRKPKTKRTIRERVLRFFVNRSKVSDPNNSYSPADIQKLGKMQDVKVLSLSSCLHRMAKDGDLERVEFRKNELYPPASRYGYRLDWCPGCGRSWETCRTNPRRTCSIVGMPEVYL